ncbi:MAG: EAL domain-containing protein, partial [Pseudomonadota bacterium]
MLMDEASSLDDTTLSASGGFKHRLTDPRIMFPVIAFVALLMIWYATFVLVDAELSSARQRVATTASDLTVTYEAQVVRALREVDLALKVIQYAYETGGNGAVLDELQARALLPPAFLFGVSVTDATGNVVASTGELPKPSVGSEEYFLQQRETDTFIISPPQSDATSSTALLHFTRRLSAPDGTFTGIVMVEVDAAYFVSGYEQAELGSQGVLGILGTDGVFRARQTGESVTYGDAVDYASILGLVNADDTQAALTVNVWDGVPRYTDVHELFAFPLAVIVGLSEEEQLSTVYASRDAQVRNSTIASVVMLLIIAVLGRLSWQLQQSRQRLMVEQVEHAQRVEYLAYHDSLTGLPNRSHFSKLLNHSVELAKRHDRRLSVLFMDLDRFKFINDTLGHDAGDELLVEVASRLRESVRASDTVARLGGDEFVVFLPEHNEEKDLVAVANKILSSVRRPFRLAGQDLRVTVSIGISTFPRDGQDEQTLMKKADIAMYNAKKEGKNVFRFYADALNSNSLERLTLESSMRGALEHNQFELHYQVTKNTRSNTITGVEALIRWHHPDLGTIEPKQFLPVAEESGLIIPIGRWVLETACLQSVIWEKEGLNHLRMAVNLSPREFFDDDLLPGISTILKKTGMNPELLEIEVSENLLMKDFDRALQILHGLTALGVRISIDNFGAGYSSLSTLKQFHLDTIKVDEAFIRDLASNAEDKTLIEAIIAMAKVLGLNVVAGGVETREQARMLGENSCDEIQGFFVSGP